MVIYTVTDGGDAGDGGARETNEMLGGRSSRSAFV